MGVLSRPNVDGQYAQLFSHLARHLEALVATSETPLKPRELSMWLYAFSTQPTVDSALHLTAVADAARAAIRRADPAEPGFSQTVASIMFAYALTDQAEAAAERVAVSYTHLTLPTTPYV